MTINKRYRWFRRAVGNTVPGRNAAYALALARAEEWAENEGVKVRWEYDQYADLSWLEPGETVNEVLGCIVSHDGYNASLWGICDPGPDYQRIIEAELADELREQLLDVAFLSVIQY